MRLLFWRKPPPKPEARKRGPRVAVHLKSGHTVVHYAKYQTIRSDGVLKLHDKPDGGDTVATYTADCWWSLSTGPRKVTKAVQP